MISPPEKEKIKALEEMLMLLGLPAGAERLGKLKSYLSLIELASSRHSLVGDKEYRKLVFKHLYDSLYPLTVMRVETGPLLDLGTGAGLPGIPLKIFLPEIPVYLLDSNRRKINFVKHACRSLGFHKAYGVTGRAESLAREPCYREAFHYLFSRAVAPIRELAKIAFPFAAPGGRLVFYKGPALEKEISGAKAVIDGLGGRIKKELSYRLPTGERRLLVIMEKL
ncbi:MAG: 16S rRNA (guanine(527)-N(7))-methyltransferase RsmG [Firmicutes bacterium]|nr:16S rRNA (guanine(527)-N(7))-methyltransferase RsmG [Bacillota bacterium]